MRHNKETVDKYKARFQAEGFQYICPERGYRQMVVFVWSTGCIVLLHDIQDYPTEFPLGRSIPSDNHGPGGSFLKMKDKVGGQWWLKGEEHNDPLIEFVNTWLNDWVGYVEETVFDVNMLSLIKTQLYVTITIKKYLNILRSIKLNPLCTTLDTDIFGMVEYIV